MAKAKDYIQELKNSEYSLESQSIIVLKIMDEIQETITKRNCHTNEAFAAVFKEHRQKWQSICNACPTLQKEGFSHAVKMCFEKMYPILIRMKAIDPTGDV